MSDALMLHERVLNGLSAVEYGGEAISLMRAAALSAFGVPDGLKSMRTSLPPEVQRVVSSLLLLTVALNDRRNTFDSALHDAQSALKELQLIGSSRRVDIFGSDATSAFAEYLNHLKAFRSTWSLLFGITYPASHPKHVPPHMFAVRWGELRRVEVMDSIRSAQRAARRTLESIERGNDPLMTYFLYILQIVHSVRVTFLESISEIFLHSALSVDVLTVVRHVFAACAAQRELVALQSLWLRKGLLNDHFTRHCRRFDAAQLASIGAHKGDTTREASLYVQCPFLWLLQRLLWSLYGRVTLLFRDCVCLFDSERTDARRAPLPDGGEAVAPTPTDAAEVAASSPSPRIPPTSLSLSFSLPVAAAAKGRRRMSMRSPGRASIAPRAPFGLQWAVNGRAELDLLTHCGCHTLARALQDALGHEVYRTTVLLFSDCTQRPGRRAWQDNHYTVATHQEDAARRQGIAHWVLNCVFPGTRLDADGCKAAQQESMLLRTFVFQAASMTGVRFRFSHPGCVFYAVRSEADMDGGRLYFVLLLHTDDTLTANDLVGGGAGDMLSAEEAIGREEAHWAFRSLEELRAAWSLPDLCNLAIQADTGGILKTA